MAPPVATIIRQPYGKTYHVAIGGTQTQRDSVYKLASSLGHSATCSADDGALVLLQNTPAGVTEFALRTIYFYGVANDQQTAFRNFVAGAYPGTVAPVIEFRAWPGEPKPAITMTATPSSITAGQSSTVTWSAPQAASATLNGAAVATTQSTTVKPAVNTTYTLVAKYADTTTQTKTVVVAVTPVTPQPVPVKHLLGVHCNANANILPEMGARGCRSFLVLDNKAMAVQLAEAYPDAIVVARRYLNKWQLNGSQLAAYILEGPNHPRVLLQGYNEQDEFNYDTPSALRTRCQNEIQCAQIVKSAGYQMIAGNFSVGTVQVNDPAILQVLREEFSTPYNNGLIWLGQHVYSPDLAHAMDSWWETRYLHYFWSAGFNPAVRHVVGTEGGTDKGGTGGFPAQGASTAQFVDWCTRYLNAVRAPITVNGLQYANPCVATMIYQVGNNTDWAGYCIGMSATDRYIPSLQGVAWA